MVPPVATPQAVMVEGETLAPHAVISGAYEKPQDKQEYLNAIFDATAADYDRVERWLSLGSGRWYRRQALVRAGLRPAMSMVDVAVGTGLLAGEALSVIGPAGRLVGVDPSLRMMERARERLGISTVHGTADALDFPDASFDFLSMGYALRHVADLHSAFREFRRVLKADGAHGPGRLCILEITRPRTRVGRAALRGYLGVLARTIGLVTRLAPRTPELWAYYAETIEKCVPPEDVVAALRKAGFRRVRVSAQLGVFSEYTALGA